ncbi:hypothetical protein KY332_00700 [Candidatus Woesearchaeota archaeon]|nr:hypothetical protein [Candidatus Woesearchaeota archaeon]
MFGFGFSEKGMKKKLDKLASSVKRSPEKADISEVILAKYEVRINRYLNSIADKDERDRKRKEFESRKLAAALEINKAKGVVDERKATKKLKPKFA